MSNIDRSVLSLSLQKLLATKINQTKHSRRKTKYQQLIKSEYKQIKMIDEIEESIVSGQMKPSVIRYIIERKKSGKVRQIPLYDIKTTLIMNYVARLVRDTVLPILGDNVYGYIPDQNIHDAVFNITKYRKKNTWWFKFDIEDAFESVDIEKLLGMVRQIGIELNIISLIEIILQHNLHQGHFVDYSLTGLSPGNGLSKWLMHLYLHQLDKYLQSVRFNFVRYVDDYVVFARTPTRIQQAILLTKKWAYDNLKIKFNQQKSKRGSISVDMEYIGYEFYKNIIRPCEDITTQYKNKIDLYISEMSTDVKTIDDLIIQLDDLRKKVNVLNGNYRFRYDRYSSKKIFQKLNSIVLKSIKNYTKTIKIPFYMSYKILGCLNYNLL